jgi:hypothetical protein
MAVTAKPKLKFMKVLPIVPKGNGRAERPAAQGDREWRESSRDLYEFRGA